MEIQTPQIGQTEPTEERLIRLSPSPGLSPLFPDHPLLILSPLEGSKWYNNLLLYKPLDLSYQPCLLIKTLKSTIISTVKVMLELTLCTLHNIDNYTHTLPTPSSLPTSGIVHSNTSSSLSLPLFPVPPMPRAHMLPRY